MKFSFDPLADLIVVPARLSGPEGSFTANLALDTGASILLIHWDIAEWLGYDPEIAPVCEDHNGQWS